MSEVTQSIGTALTLNQRATLALGLSDIERTLRDLASRSEPIKAITNSDGYQQVHSARMALKNQRVEIEKRGKAAREDAQAFSKAVIAEEKRLIGIIEPEEQRLQKLQKAHDDAIEATRQAKIEAELKRVSNLQERVAYLRGNRMLSTATGSALIAEHISDLESEPVDESFQEFQQQAADAKTAGLTWLRELHAAAVAQEAEQARIKAEREELARLRAEEEKRQAAERARIADEERKAKAERDAEAKRQAEALRVEQEKLAAERAEQERANAAERARIAEEEKQAKAAREAEEQRLAGERAEFERQQAEAKKVREAEEKRKAEQARLAAMKPPSAGELIDVLARHYQVPATKIVDWILAIDFSEVRAA